MREFRVAAKVVRLKILGRSARNARAVRVEPFLSSFSDYFVLVRALLGLVFIRHDSILPGASLLCTSNP